MNKVLVTGGNRGIGLELCKQFQARGDDVIATCRISSSELDALNIRVIEGVDVGDDASVRRLAKILSDVKLDILLNNAGILTVETLDDLNFDRIRDQFEINTLGPLRVCTTLSNNLSSGSKIGIITSRVGSIADNGSGGIYGYRISKAAANMVGVNLALELKDQHIAVALLHPGLIATEMTNYRGESTETAAQGLIARLDGLSLENSGTFWHANGEVLPW